LFLKTIFEDCSIVYVTHCAGDVFLSIFQQGQGAALDVTVINTLQAQKVNRTASYPGSAAKTSKKQQNYRFASRCDNVGINFIPLVMETLGGDGKRMQPSTCAGLPGMCRQRRQHHISSVPEA
jgi:hypothetical protein